MNTIGKNIKYYREEHNLTQTELAKRIGVTDKAVSTWENGTREPRMGVIDAMSALFGVDKVKLMGLDQQHKPNGVPDIQPLPETVRRPRLGTIACGQPILCEENLDGYDEVPENMRCDFTLLCKGDSMIGARILDGDIVYIRQQPEVENGEIAAVLVDGSETTLKRFYRSGDIITLQAENPAYPPIIVTQEQQCVVLGKAIGFTSSVR